MRNDVLVILDLDSLACNQIVLQIGPILELDLYDVTQALCVHYLLVLVLVRTVLLAVHGYLVFTVNVDVLIAEVSHDDSIGRHVGVRGQNLLGLNRFGTCAWSCGVGFFVLAKRSTFGGDLVGCTWNFRVSVRGVLRVY